MADSVVWMDSDKAHIFRLGVEGVEKTNVTRKVIDHHTHNKKDHHGDPSQDHFFGDLSAQLKTAEKILIVGPGLAKNHFATYVEGHQTGHLEKRIVGVENCDHPTDAQILALARKFFQHYNLFNTPIRST